MVGKKIKKLLEDTGASTYDLASGIGVTPAAIYRWFNKESLDSKHLEACAEFFNVPIQYFFTESEGVYTASVHSKNKDVDEEMQSVIENLQQALEALKEENEELRKDKEELRRDKEDIRRDKDRVFDMLTNALEFRRSLSGDSSMPGKAEGSVSERLSQAPKENPMPNAGRASQQAAAMPSGIK